MIIKLKIFMKRKGCKDRQKKRIEKILNYKVKLNFLIMRMKEY